MSREQREEMEEESSVIGISDAFHQVLARASELAMLNRPVLIIGERGTGKELIASRLHFLSPRWEKPYIKLNCATLSESLLESELFGHEAGAFTGAVKVHKGRFERAHQGSLFLDELGAMSLRLQEKVLRTIEYGELERLGGGQTLRIQTRLIAASNEDLPAKAREGSFRADLLDRLSFEVLTLPPLRARKQDIILLAEHFATKMTRELGRDYFPGFTDKACATLLEYDWPGNVRELKNVVERSIYRHQEDEKLVDEIVLDPFASPYSVGRVQEVKSAVIPPMREAYIGGNFVDQVAAFEQTLLQGAMRVQRFNQKKAAEHLGLTYHQFRGLIRKYGLHSGTQDT